MQFIKKTVFFLIVFFLFSLSSCSKKAPSTADGCYFAALQQLENDNLSEVVFLLTKGGKKKPETYASLCNETLLPILYKQKKYNEILPLIQKIGKQSDSIEKYRLLALFCTQSNSFPAEMEKWLFNGEINADKKSFLNEFYNNELYTRFYNHNSVFVDNFSPIAKTRIAVYNRDYVSAVKQLEWYLPKDKTCASFLVQYSPEVITDIGKAYLYGKENKMEKISLFLELAECTSNPEVKSICYFYAAEFCNKTGKQYYSKALDYYRSAMQYAVSNLQADRTLWYYLELSRKTAPLETAQNLYHYSEKWHDPEYFDDFLDNLAYDLLSKYQWKLFETVYTENSNFFSPGSKAKYAYITGRLIESDLIKQFVPDVKYLYEIASTNTPLNSYYGILARTRLEKSFSMDISSDVHKILQQNDSISISEFHEELVQGYFENNLSGYVFPFIQNNYNRLSTNTILNAESQLQTAEGFEASLYGDFVRLGAKIVDLNPNRKTFCMAYPQFFNEIIEKEADDNNFDHSILYALVRSESYFIPDVKSSAGAIGLTQLMEATASDVSRRFHENDYDLTDPEINVKFGAYYIAELTGRLNGNILLASLSYNAGITRVRSWIRSSPDLPMDIFLETVPYEETRLYGQKILTASTMYSVLYENRPYTEIPSRLMNFLY